MTWMKALCPLVAALAVPACSFPCDRTGDFRNPVKTASGSGQVVIECKSTGRKLSYPAPTEWALSAPYDLETKKYGIEARLRYQPEPNASPRELSLVFDSALADGTYTLDAADASAQVKLEDWVSNYSGTVSLSRTRDLPFVDVSDPAPGEYDSRIELTLQLQGTTGYESKLSCPESLVVSLAPSSFQLDKHTVVGMCDGGDVLEGLSEIRGGGH